MLYDLFLAPFIEYRFLQNALLGSMLIALGSVPIGLFLMLRKMSLVGDAMSHAILPGVAAGFLVCGLNIIPMALGGLFAGLIVAFLAGIITRLTNQYEDASMAAFYLISLGIGVLLISLRGSNVDLIHILFGTVLALTNENLNIIILVSGCTLLFMRLFWRALVADTLDPLFLRSVSMIGPRVHLFFLAFVVLNLVSGFQALGTLLSVGLLILPAVTARFWATTLKVMCLMALVIALFSCYSGLLLSYYFSLPSGPAIILCLGGLYLLSALFGKKGLFIQCSIRHNTLV